jgi:hypothetical protein
MGDLVSREEPQARELGGSPRALSRHRKKDGAFIDVELTSFAVAFRGRSASLDCILDVTWRRKSEDQARYLDLLLATVESSMGHGTTVCVTVPLPEY